MVEQRHEVEQSGSRDKDWNEGRKRGVQKKVNDMGGG